MLSSAKRYSGEGAEAMQPAVDALLRASHGCGVKEVVVSTPQTSERMSGCCGNNLLKLC